MTPEVSAGHDGGMSGGDVDIARTAALFADPARVRVLTALADGRALAASVLAGEAGVSAPGVSAHLAKLREAGLVEAERSGRHRFYRLRPDAVEIMETLARHSPPSRSPRSGRGRGRRRFGSPGPATTTSPAGWVCR
ncbi:ArsR family transcriptional regulator [Amycolatopsis methanolica 239]|uniref:ArsR family transcriptional regulator n=2 Tax=Amycolatopsis methanolica TaxID=1814 RepID=A0A076MYG9_AMYME|nr:ArsR family transcriptional regulator [Amycolatopsis methanolica 239]